MHFILNSDWMLNWTLLMSFFFGNEVTWLNPWNSVPKSINAYTFYDDSTFCMSLNVFQAIDDLISNVIQLILVHWVRVFFQNLLKLFNFEKQHFFLFRVIFCKQTIWSRVDVFLCVLSSQLFVCIVNSISIINKVSNNLPL